MLSALITLACAGAFAATVYKWVDENGVTHYSDQPHPNSKTIELKSAQTYQSEERAPPAPEEARPENTESPYALCELYRPENDEVFLNTTTVTSKLRLNPQLRPGDRVEIWLDGQRLSNQPSAGTDFVLTEMTRGTHQLNAVVADAEGKPLCKTATTTFHVRQPSVQAPNRANRPRF